jgi:hypothetical protein
MIQELTPFRTCRVGGYTITVNASGFLRHKADKRKSSEASTQHDKTFPETGGVSGEYRSPPGDANYQILAPIRRIKTIHANKQ